MCGRRTFVATFPNRSTERTVAEICDLPTPGSRHVDPHERLRGRRRPELPDRDAGGEVRGGRREHVARVEGPRDLRQAVALVRRARARSVTPSSSAASISRPLSGPTNIRPSAVAMAIARRSATDSGIDDGEVHADRAGRASCSGARARPGAPPAARCRASRRSRARRERCRRSRRGTFRRNRPAGRSR